MFVSERFSASLKVFCLVVYKNTQSRRKPFYNSNLFDVTESLYIPRLVLKGFSASLCVKTHDLVRGPFTPIRVPPMSYRNEHPLYDIQDELRL